MSPNPVGSIAQKVIAAGATLARAHGGSYARGPSGAPLDLLQKRLGLGFAGLAIVTWGLLIFGSTVRVHGAGLSCPDWPLCFGELIPQLDFRVFLEWGHRVLAGAVSIGFLGLGGAVLAHPGLRPRFGLLVGAMVVVLASQIVLGGLTVLQSLAFWSVTLHLLFGNTFMALMIGMARRLRGAVPEAAASGVVRGAVGAVAGLVTLQMALGGLVSSNYAGLACIDWPSCNGGVWFPAFDGAVGLQVFHRLGGYGVFVAAVGLAVAARADEATRRPAWLLLVLVLTQITLGVINVLMRMPVELAIAHAATAHAIVATTAWLVAGTYARGAAPAPAPARA